MSIATQRHSIKENTVPIEFRENDELRRLENCALLARCQARTSRWSSANFKNC